MRPTATGNSEIGVGLIIFLLNVNCIYTSSDVCLCQYMALSRNQVKLGFLLAINCFIPDIIANVVAYSGQI